MAPTTAISSTKIVRGRIAHRVQNRELEFWLSRFRTVLDSEDLNERDLGQRQILLIEELIEGRNDARGAEDRAQDNEIRLSGRESTKVVFKEENWGDIRPEVKKLVVGMHNDNPETRMVHNDTLARPGSRSPRLSSLLLRSCGSDHTAFCHKQFIRTLATKYPVIITGEYNTRDLRPLNFCE